MPSVQRERDLRRYKRRKAKLRKLRARLNDTRETKERAKLIAKIRKRNPFVPLPEK